MKKFIVVTWILIISTNGNAQSQVNLAGWDTAILRLANSAASVSYMSNDEKKVLFYINLCRMQPRRFAKTFLAGNFDSVLNDSNSNPYFQSLIRDLRGAKPRHPLAPDSKVYEMANKWAKHMAKTGEFEHGDFENRYKRYINDGNMCGENIYYGDDEPLGIVLDLLIDQDVEDLGHRKNIMALPYTKIGIAIVPYSQNGNYCVMDFVGDISEIFATSTHR